MNDREFRTKVLTDFGASRSEIDELLDYNQNVFDCSSLKFLPQFPLVSEPHLSVWEEYASEASAIGAFKTLQSVLVQLKFPIQKDISQSYNYRAATLRGIATEDLGEATGLILKQPEKLQLQIYSSLAGAIPVLFTSDSLREARTANSRGADSEVSSEYKAPFRRIERRDSFASREDFVSLVQALTKRNEPVPIPDSMGACLVAGYNNWDRIDRYRRQWQSEYAGDRSETDWQEEFQRLIKQKELYQDRFIIVSDGFYSGVSASALGLSESQWRSLSLTIRLEHECTHYFTRRLFNSMRNNLLDELIADYRGIVAAIGFYRADWFLHFLGLESYPHYREGGRMQNYRGQPPLSDRAFTILQALVKAAAENLEGCFCNSKLDRQPALAIASLSNLTLEELASDEMDSLLHTSLEKLKIGQKTIIY
jgi:hypothetical protein